MMTSRRVLSLVLMSALAVVAGCASLGQVASEVVSYGSWPAGRAPGSYAFDRLPSQQAQAEAQSRLEEAAKPALESAGLRPAAPGTQPDVLVQVGARATRVEASPWHDPLWWRGGYGLWRPAPWPGVRWYAVGLDDRPRIEQEVAVLLRDRATGQPLIEARATSSDGAARSAEGLRAMFIAALNGFPATAATARTVTVPLVVKP